MIFPKGVYKTSKPKMSFHRGRTWDVCDVILPDGNTVVKGHYDTTWGRNCYFSYKEKWFYVDIYQYDYSGPDSILIKPDLSKKIKL